MPALRAIVHGDVQGVGFRDFVQRRARRAGLSGWVRNRPDGTVEVVAEGGRRQLGELLEELNRGPGMASIDRVDAGWEAEHGLQGFSIKF
jgi:acylphosphatase